jgi:Holliday junction DNA helicase RuvA
MIASLRGVVIDREAGLDGSPVAQLVIEVAGVGYRVYTTAATVGRVPGDQEVQLHIHHHIREADQRLYGFLTKDERLAFEGLLSAHGVGPALALAVLATYPVSELARILADDDLTALCEVPGVGKKTAQRLLVELKATVVLPVLVGDGATGGAVVGSGTVDSLADVREALANLGYSAAEIRKALADVHVEDGGDAGLLLKQALLNLSA